MGTDAPEGPGRLTLPADPARDHMLGDPRAPVTLLVYGDYECPFTRKGMRIVQRLLPDFEGRVRFAYRQFPLTHKHPRAMPAAAVAEAAAAQGRFWETHHLLFRHQDDLGDGELRRHAADAGCDLDALEAEIASGRPAGRVREDAASGWDSGVRGTPAFFVGVARYDGDTEAGLLRTELERAVGGRGE
jgi:protein-disulfide isomerase